MMPSVATKIDDVPPALSPQEHDGRHPAIQVRVTAPDRSIARSQAVDPGSEDADRELHAMVARLTGGISPVALALAYFDWAAHLAAAPQRRLEIAKQVTAGIGKLVQSVLHYASPEQAPWSLIKPKPQDRRFAAPEWDNPPFNLGAQAFLLAEQWWHDATTGGRGVAPANEAIVEFSVRQVLDMMAPSNFAASNPEVLKTAFQSGGENFVLGWQNWCWDLMRALHPEKSTPEQ